jgi:hypothetical protein
LTIGWNFSLFHSPSLPSAVLAPLQGESFYLLHYYNSSGAGILEENFKNIDKLSKSLTHPECRDYDGQAGGEE